MTIAMVGTRGVPADYSGIEEAIEEVSARLVNKGHKVIVYCRASDNRQKIYRGIERVILPTIETKHLGTIVHVFLATLHLLFKKIDIVHYHALGPSALSFVPRLLGKKTIVTIHGLDWQRKKWGVVARVFLRLCEYSSIFFPNKTIVISNTLKDYFERKFKRGVYYIPNGIKVSPKGKTEGLDKYGLKENNYILFVGRLVPEKGVHYLIKAFNELNTDMRLAIAGKGSFTDSYVRLLREMSNPRVKFLGFIPNERLKALYENAFLFVLPSEMEGLSISLLEAMGYGKCVIASNLPECQEVIGNYGFFFKAKDYKDLSRQLQRLINSPEIARETGIKAKAYITQRYDWDRITDEIERLYSL